MKVERELAWQRSRLGDLTRDGGCGDPDPSAGGGAGAPASQLEANVAVLRESWGLLRRRAGFLAQHRVDADDLLAGAVAATWEKWVAGTGPSTNIGAYITQSMRNRVIDELRSPRAGEVPLDVLLVHPAHVDDRSRIDRHVENTQLRSALGRLPEDMQRVLIDVVVDGRKPGDLEAEYRMSAPMISTAAYRAKKLLRAELFLEVIRGSCTRSECALPQERAARDLRRHGKDGHLSNRHTGMWECDDCTTGVRHYLLLSGRDAG